MTTIITTKGGNAAYPPLKVVSTNTGVTIPYLPPGDKPDTNWLSKALRDDGSKPTRGSRATAVKLASMVSVIYGYDYDTGNDTVTTIPRPLVYVSCTGIVCFRWEVAPNAWLDVECKASDKMCYSGKSGWGQVSGIEKLGDTLPEVIGFWLRRLYG